MMKFYSKRYFMISLTMVILFASIFCAKKEKDEKKKAIEIVRHRTLGLAYLEEDKLKEAENEFKSLIKLAPGEAMAYANLGLTYMRMAKYDEAEQQVKKALKLEPGNPDIRLILAEIYDLTNRPEQAIKILEETLSSTPDHIKSLYKLAQLYGRLSTPEALQRQLSLLKRVVELQPANIAARLQLMELLIRNGQGSEALAHLEDLIKQIPEMPKEARPYYDQAFELLHANHVEEALRPVRILHNFLKITPLYQSNIVELKGPRGSQIGFPVLTFSHEITTQIQEPRSILEAMQFTDVTASAKLDSIEFFPGTTNSQGIVAVADFDNDGDQDIYFANWNPQTQKGHHYLLRNNLGRFSDIAGNAGVTHRGKDLDAIFADYNNDGYLDLFVVNEKGNFLYNNVAEGKFADMATKAGLNAQTSAVKALFADFDHEGDLDLFLATRGRNLFYRNNMDGTFIEMADKMGLSEPIAQSQDAIFADFDDDGDLDLFVVNDDRSNVLYSNLRGGRFENITDEAGLSNQGHSGAVTIGDYNNDGFVDLFITGMENGQHTLYKNNGDGTFKVDRTPEELYQNLQNVIGYDTEFLDFDNDGLLDLLVVGKSKENARAGRGIRIFHNEGDGKFKDTTNLLPDNLTSGFRLSVFDYNEDGDLDLLIAGFDGSLRLLRNDGGNANKYLKIRLVGLRSGSGKNNYFGIGSKIEVRAGDLYQMRVVTHPMTHFGLGHRLKADVVRILWPNGVPQNLFYPGSDQDLIETQTLKGSCAFLYTWNGREFQFLTDIMWRSALGMPLGIMGSETAYAFPNSSDEHLRIPGDRLKPDHGKYQLRVTEELWETAYFD
ncbi:MAG: tetratricopeptide repeat protein, partial [Calditrichaeota bacterium]